MNDDVTLGIKAHSRAGLFHLVIVICVIKYTVRHSVQVHLIDTACSSTSLHINNQILAGIGQEQVGF